VRNNPEGVVLVHPGDEGRRAVGVGIAGVKQDLKEVVRGC